jgi:ketosteroid isomerase-like protein
MLRTLPLVVGLLIGSAILNAQDAVKEVLKAVEDQIAAAQARDAKAYERFLADDLRWVGGPDGTVSTKKDRVQSIASGATVPTFREIDVKVSGDVATLVAIQTFPDGQRSRVSRAYVKRDGRWLLLLHASSPMK